MKISEALMRQNVAEQLHFAPRVNWNEGKFAFANWSIKKTKQNDTEIYNVMGPHK